MGMRTKVLIFTFLGLILLTNIFAQQETVIVQATAKIIDGDKNKAKEEAIANATKLAAEKGLKVWLESQNNSSSFSSVRDEIISKADVYVSNQDILKKGKNDVGEYTVTLEATVDIGKIGQDFKKTVSEVSSDMGNPSITFVLTTWKIKGSKKTLNITDDQEIDYEGNYDGSLESNYEGQAGYKYDGSAKADVESDKSGSEYHGSADVSVNENIAASSGEKEDLQLSEDLEASSEYNRNLEIEEINEEIWTKVADMSIIDAFQQEFKEKNFDIMAADKAREIALAESIASTSLNISDRKKVREEAAKEGANFVARGEAMIIDVSQSNSSANYNASVKLGVEIIDVNSGDIVASYSNSVNALANNGAMAQAQAIKKNAILGARTLAAQTLNTWQKRADQGKQFTIELRNFTSTRSQQRPFTQAIDKIVENVNNITMPDDGVLLLKVIYKGDKMTLGNTILDTVGILPGFEEGKFDGPLYIDGKLVFKFL